jgi:hypothetical protein
LAVAQVGLEIVHAAIDETGAVAESGANLPRQAIRAPGRVHLGHQRAGVENQPPEDRVVPRSVLAVPGLEPAQLDVGHDAADVVLDVADVLFAAGCRQWQQVLERLIHRHRQGEPEGGQRQGVAVGVLQFGQLRIEEGQRSPRRPRAARRVSRMRK